MGVKKIRVNTESLGRTRKELQGKLDKIRKDIDQIADDMNALHSMWEGDAHQAFRARVSEDISFLGSVCDGIQSIVNYEECAVTEYNKCERQVSDLISQIGI